MRKTLLLLFLLVFVKIASAQCYTVSQITYAPDSFNLGAETDIQLDDHYTCTMSLPFPFCFFGTSYSRFLIGSNGAITFDTSWACSYCLWPINMAIPMTNSHKASIMFPWQDLDFAADTGSHIYVNTYGVTPNRRFVVSFYHAPMYSCTTQQFTGEIILYETSNVIEMHIQNKPVCTSWNGGYAIEGIQDMTGTQAAVVPGRNYPAQWTAVNDAWRFIPNCCSVGILPAEPGTKFSVYPNPSGGEIHFTSFDLSAGEFYLEAEDLSGRIIYSGELSGAGERTIRLNAPAGIYLLRMRGANGELLGTKKIALE